jgi:hypothetical protein
MTNLSKFFSVIFFLFCGFIYSQNLDNSRQNSVVIPPPGYSPTGTDSDPITINGFDNYYLGTDFGEPYIAVNPTDPKKQVCAYNTNSFYYTLNGVDWTRSFPSFPGYAVVGDPCMTYDNSGNLFYVTLYSPNVSSGPWGIVVGKSTNNGVSWLNYYQAHQTSGGLDDKEWITADLTGGPYNNNLYIGWKPYSASGMGFIRSTNNGVNWSDPLILSGGQGAYVSVGPNGNIQGGYLYFACTIAYIGNILMLHRSSDGGATFQYLGYVVTGATPPGNPYGSNSRPTLKNTHIRCDNMPRMAVDNSYSSTRGYAYIVYASNPPGPDLADIFFVKSTDYGVSWSTPVKLNDDATTTDQWMPTISVDNTGKIFVSWYDSRNDPTNNILTDIYGTTSSNGGVSFAPDNRISNQSFNPDNMAIINLTDASYIGDYFGTASTGNGTTSVTSWMDNRSTNTGIMQSFVGYNPDFAMTTNPTQKYMGNNDSVNFAVSVPGIRGIFSDRVKFTASLDTLPASGTIQLSFINGKDSIATFPDSVRLKVKTVGTVTPGGYHISILGSGRNGTPVHRRKVDIYVNASSVTVQTNRENIVTFKVNGAPYTTHQNFIFTNGTIINVQAVSPLEQSANKYVFHHWSDAGDTAHNVTISAPLTLTAFYNVQYKLIINSSIPYTFGGNQFYDSAASAQFGVTNRVVNYSGIQYVFKGWDGMGTGSYTSPDSSGTDTVRTISLSNAVVETPRWVSSIGINSISSLIPEKNKLFQNYPNPFNPSTNIKFQITNNSFITLKVYDILGKEVATLVNKNLQAGTYEVPFSTDQFTGIRISSGIYFYRITAGQFTEIKKLVILK